MIEAVEDIETLDVARECGFINENQYHYLSQALSDAQSRVFLSQELDYRDRIVRIEFLTVLTSQEYG